MGKSSNFNIVRSAGTWNCFRCGHEKMLKTDVFHKTLIPRNLLKEKNIQDRTMWKRTSWRFRKCGTYWACEVLNGSYMPSKMDESQKTGPSPKLRGVQKKKTRPQYRVGSMLIQFQAPKLDIVAVFNASFPWNVFFNFDPTLTANNSGFKPLNLEKYHIFGMLWTSAFTWYTLVRSY